MIEAGLRREEDEDDAEDAELLNLKSDFRDAIDDEAERGVVKP